MTHKTLPFLNHNHKFLLLLKDNNDMDSIKSFLQKQNKWHIVAGSVLLLLGVKLYFRGAVCRVDRDLNGKFIVVTGGNAGIGK